MHIFKIYLCLAGAITKGVVLMEKIAGSFTNASSTSTSAHDDCGALAFRR
jgi:hypothetical protein